MAKKFRLPVFLTAPTHGAWQRQCKDAAGNRVQAERVELFSPGKAFTVGDIEVMPFTIPHDAADPVGFRFTAEGVRMAIATDLGFLPQNVRDQLRRCDGLVLESNHDLEMLRLGPYPWAVKQRVMSRVGHLSNQALAEFLASDYDGGAAFLILAHLSEQNNLPDLARIAAERALGMRQALWGYRLVLASQDEPLSALTL
jgi:phosphoribosyl 1,2-cyclic phosphodiesterase